MEDLTPPVQTNEQPKASPRAEEMMVDPIPESPGDRRLAEESTAAAGELGSGEHLVPIADGSATMPGAMVETARSSAVNAGDAGATPKSGVEKLVAPEEQTAPLEAS